MYVHIEDLCMAICGVQIPDWINRPAKTGAAALEALNAPLKVCGYFCVCFVCVPPCLHPGDPALEAYIE